MCASTLGLFFVSLVKHVKDVLLKKSARQKNAILKHAVKDIPKSASILPSTTKQRTWISISSEYDTPDGISKHSEKCEVCEYAGSTMTLLKRHISTKHKQKSFTQM